MNFICFDSGLPVRLPMLWLRPMSSSVLRRDLRATGSAGTIANAVVASDVIAGFVCDAHAVHLICTRCVFVIGGTPAFHRQFGRFVSDLSRGASVSLVDFRHLLFRIGGTLAFHRQFRWLVAIYRVWHRNWWDALPVGVLFTADLTSSTLNILLVIQTIWKRIGS
jgi:hypothetical protein